MKNKKLIALMSAGLIATTLSTTACSDNMNFKEMATTLSYEIDDVVLDIPSFVMQIKQDSYLLTFIGHSASAGDKDKGYIDHKDYLVTYSISKKDYFEIYKICLERNFFIINYDISQCVKYTDNFITIKPLLDDIMENYEPISIKEVEMDKSHNYYEFINPTY